MFQIKICFFSEWIRDVSASQKNHNHPKKEQLNTEFEYYQSGAATIFQNISPLCVWKLFRIYALVDYCLRNDVLQFTEATTVVSLE